MLVTLLIVATIGAIAWWLYSRSPRRQSFPQRPPKKLVSLLNGDLATAYRLFEKAQLRYPDKSNQWYWEKVTWDLERDRRRG